MIEPKLCPYRKIVTTEFFEKDDPEKIGFGPCLQDKCAMWRDTKCIGSDSSNLYVKGEFGWGYCGLAGKP